jgi:hypothetical protein
MPAHLIQAMPLLVLGLGALAGIAATWLRGRRAGGQQAAAARRDLAVALALAACWAAVWVLYATYTWTAAPGLSMLQAARFYVRAVLPVALSHFVSGRAGGPWRLYYTRYYTGAAVSTSGPAGTPIRLVTKCHLAPRT